MDTTARDALERSLNARLPLCDEEELRALSRVLVSIEKRRDLADVIKRVRARDAVEAGLRELRDAPVVVRAFPFFEAD